MREAAAQYCSEYTHFLPLQLIHQYSATYEMWQSCIWLVRDKKNTAPPSLYCTCVTSSESDWSFLTWAGVSLFCYTSGNRYLNCMNAVRCICNVYARCPYRRIQKESRNTFEPNGSGDDCFRSSSVCMVFRFVREWLFGT